jgi:hypothetical protein
MPLSHTLTHIHTHLVVEGASTEVYELDFEVCGRGVGFHACVAGGWWCVCVCVRDYVVVSYLL